MSSAVTSLRSPRTSLCAQCGQQRPKEANAVKELADYDRQIALLVQIFQGSRSDVVSSIASSPRCMAVLSESRRGTAILHGSSPTLNCVGCEQLIFFLYLRAALTRPASTRLSTFLTGIGMG